MPTLGDDAREVTGIDLYVRSDAEQLAHLVDLVDRGELRVDVARRAGLQDLAAVHAEASTGSPSGKVVVVPDSA